MKIKRYIVSKNFYLLIEATTIYRLNKINVSQKYSCLLMFVLIKVIMYSLLSLIHHISSIYKLSNNYNTNHICIITLFNLFESSLMWVLKNTCWGQDSTNLSIDKYMCRQLQIMMIEYLEVSMRSIKSE